MTLKRWLALGLLTGSAAVLTPACGPSVGSLCDDACDCRGCSDRDYDNCVIHEENLELRAERRGCLDFYDDYLACRHDTGFCSRGFDYDHDCGPEKKRLDNCID